MTQYLLSVWHDHFDADVAAIEPADMERMFAQVDAFNTELQDTGAWVFAGGLNSPSRHSRRVFLRERSPVEPTILSTSNPQSSRSRASR